MVVENGTAAAEQPAVPVDGKARKRGLLFLGAAAGAVSFAMAVQMGLNANFLAQDLGLSGASLGILEAFRESCGIIALGVLAILAGFAEPLIATAMLLLLALGIAAYSSVWSFPSLVAASIVWSLGLHVWMPLPNSLTHALSEPRRFGFRLGQIQSAGAVGFFAGLTAAWLLTHFHVLPLRPLYLLAGASALLGALLCFGVPRRIKVPGPRFVFRRRYALYYLLNFLEGWRKQIAIAFAGFMLVRVHHTSLQTMLILWGLPQAVIYFISPSVGKLIDRVGERRILLFYYASLALLFLGYATCPWSAVLYALFVVDNTFFVLAMSLTTYVGRIAPRSELTPTLSMGVAFNHVAAVTMPLVGGFIWYAFGYRWTFLIGAVASLLSILAVVHIPRHLPAQYLREPAPSEY